jgi:hypothetical protein
LLSVGVFEKPGDERCPSGLVTGAQAAAVVAVKELVKED